jgi:outer membrane protein OmpA-like peptidoglycan-associated protein
MRRCGIIALAFLWSAVAQNTVPLYRVTVIEHRLQAVNYQYRSGPTEIDFRGTVLLGKAKGRATVESHPGRTEIDAKMQGLTSPQGFGKEYLTYVLWAISPEGAPHNLGEIVPNGSNAGHLRVTTALQAFGLMVTAEPYAAVKQPSDVVVLENRVRPETIGKIEPIVAKAELLPRGHYVLDQQERDALLNPNGPKVSMNEYEQISQIYQAENALNLARAAGAETLAADTFAKAQQLLGDAKQKRENKAGTNFVVQSAREAAQTADDARAIAMKRAQDKRIESAEQRAASAEQAAQQARAQAAASFVERKESAEVTESAPAPATAPAVESHQDLPIAPPPPREDPPPMVLKNRQAQAAGNPQMQTRARLLAQLKKVAEPLDTPRGISIVIPDSEFAAGSLTADQQITLTKVAEIIAPVGLKVTVGGYSDSEAGETLSRQRAEAVRDALVDGGLKRGVVEAYGFGKIRPTTSNATEAGRIANRRVEILITGVPIGEEPLWDHSYPLTSH